MSDETVARPAQQMSVVLMAATLHSVLSSGRTIVALLLLGYAGEGQFFPGAVLGLFWKRADQAEVSTGLVIGIAAVAVLILSERDPFPGLKAGFVALLLNLAVTIFVSLLSPSRQTVEETG